MNKKEVAKFLGVSTRQVEKYASKGQLGKVIYVRGKTGRQAKYDKDAVEKLKTALETPDTAIATTTPDARLFVAQLMESLNTREQPRNEPVRVSEKILLNIKDCRELTGLSDARIRAAIKSKKLKARIIGRGYKIKRKDLDKFIDNL